MIAVGQFCSIVNSPAFRSAAFAQACLELGIIQKFTRAYRPQTNSKAELFIQSALREWAYGRARLWPLGRTPPSNFMQERLDSSYVAPHERTILWFGQHAVVQCRRHHRGGLKVCVFARAASADRPQSGSIRDMRESDRVSC